LTDFRRDHATDQQLDIAGSSVRADDQLPLTDESSGLGRTIQSGTGATIAVAGSVVTVSGLSGLTGNSYLRLLEFTDAINLGNNGAFFITEVVDGYTARIDNSSAVAESGLDWAERQPYSLEDDINYERTDRRQIKGVGYDRPVPTYIRISNTGALVPANLSNIAGKTTDAKALLYWIRSESVSVNATDTYALLSKPGELPYADGYDRTGVPISDGYDVGNDESTVAVVVDADSNAAIRVLAGVDVGKLVYGDTRQGGSGVDGDSVEIEFRAVDDGYDLSTSVAYIWEGSQTNAIGIFYPYRERLDRLPEYVYRPVVSSGGAGSGDVTGAANVGSGADIFKNKVGAILNFRGVEGTNDISTVVNGDNVEVDGSALLPLDGSRSMTGNLDMDGYNIINLGEPVDPSDAVTKSYVDGYSFELVIPGQQQGSVIYFDGSVWVQLSPGTDGYVLTTHGPLDDPSWDQAPGAASGVTPAQHAALRQLIHLADGIGGPFEEFVSGAYREILPVAAPFPTNVIWWESSSKNKKIVEKTHVRNARQLPITTQWKAYGSDGVSVLATVTDNIVYQGVFEIDRTRTVS
jgi:hypothetical protein